MVADVGFQAPRRNVVADVYLAQTALRDVVNRTIARNAIEERPLRAFAAKTRQRLPDRKRDVLRQVLRVLGILRIASSETRQSCTMRVEEAREPRVEFGLRHNGNMECATSRARRK